MLAPPDVLGPVARRSRLSIRMIAATSPTTDQRISRTLTIFDRPRELAPVLDQIRRCFWFKVEIVRIS